MNIFVGLVLYKSSKSSIFHLILFFSWVLFKFKFNSRNMNTSQLITLLIIYSSYFCISVQTFGAPAFNPPSNKWQRIHLINTLNSHVFLRCSKNSTVFLFHRCKYGHFDIFVPNVNENEVICKFWWNQKYSSLKAEDANFEWIINDIGVFTGSQKYGWQPVVKRIRRIPVRTPIFFWTKS